MLIKIKENVKKLKKKSVQMVIISHAASVLIGIVLAGILASLTDNSLLVVYSILLGTYAVNPIQSRLFKKMNNG